MFAVGFLLFAMSYPLVVHARAPAAVVIEVADAEINNLKQGQLLGECKGIVLSGGEAFISKALADQVRYQTSVREGVHIEQGLKASEEISRIVLLRSRQRCGVYLSAKKLPPLEDTFRQLPGNISWKLDDDTLILKVGSDQFDIKPEMNWVAGRFRDDGEARTVRIHNYGRLALWEGKPEARKRRISAGDTLRLRLDGPGDRIHLLMTAPEQGAIGIRLIPGKAQSAVKMDLYPHRRPLKWKTGRWYSVGDREEIELILSSKESGPQEFILRSDFSTAGLGPVKFSCTLEKGEVENDGRYPLRLRFTNTGRATAPVYKLTHQVVQRFLDGKQLGPFEIWELPPEKVLLDGGESLFFPAGSFHEDAFPSLRVQVDTPPMNEKWQVRSRERGNPVLCPVDGSGKVSWRWFEILGQRSVNPVVVEQMILDGWDVNRAGQIDGELRYPLAMATAGPRINPRVIQMLLRAGAKPDIRDHSGRTPLHIAAHSGSGDAVAMLIRAGADVNARDDEQSAPLHLLDDHFLKASPLPVARLLIGSGADVNARSDAYGTPLHQAVKHEHIGLAELLIEKGADVAATDSRGDRPMHIAAAYNRVDTMKLLKKGGAAIDVKNRAGQTPLHKAAENTSAEAARWLLDQGADIEARSKDGVTPLLMASITASAANKPEIVKLLLERDAKIDVKDDQGNTPLSFAEKLNPDIYKILKEAKKRLENGG
jgi:ankyrin repeat protein